MARSMSGPDQTLIIACGALAREIREICACNSLDHLTLTCLPADLHNRPSEIPAAVEACVAKHRPAYARILIAYGDCGTGGRLAALCDRIGVEMIDAPHCYAFFEGAEAFAAHPDEIDAFYLTDFLARQFEAFVWKPLGLDRHPDLREVYFAHYTKLVFLTQTDEPALDIRARNCAARLGLDYEKRVTGYGDLMNWLSRTKRSDAAPR